MWNQLKKVNKASEFSSVVAGDIISKNWIIVGLIR